MGKVRKVAEQPGRAVYSWIPRPPGWKDLGAWQWTKHVLDLGFRVAFPPLAHSWSCNLDPLPWSWPISGDHSPARAHLKKMMYILLRSSLRTHLQCLPLERNKTLHEKESSVHPSGGISTELFLSKFSFFQSLRGPKQDLQSWEQWAVAARPRQTP